MRFVVPSFVFAASLAAALTGALAQSQPVTTNPGAQGATPAPTSATTAPAANDQDDVVSCRYEKTTGSLFPKRICHTQREWHQMSTDAKNYLDNLDRGKQDNGIGN